VRVPEEAANGKAKLTFSFPDWKDRQVASTTAEVVVKQADASGGASK